MVVGKYASDLYVLTGRIFNGRELVGIKLVNINDYSVVYVKKLNFEKVFAVYRVLNCTYKNGRLQVSSKLDISKFPRYNRYGSLAGNRKDYYTESEIIAYATHGNIDEVTYNICGALVYGAITDPDSTDADRHAELYYNEIRAMTTDVERIAKNTSYPIEIIQQIKNYLFMDQHRLVNGTRRFDPSFAIAQSWQRLMSKNGKDIQPHDLILLRHEMYEAELVSRGIPQSKAHIEACKLFNYPVESNNYYKNLKRR